MLAIYTAAPFVRVPGDHQQEWSVIKWWACGLQPHPALTYIRIWYRSRLPGNGVITHWSLASGTWQNIISSINPPKDTPF